MCYPPERRFFVPTLIAPLVGFALGTLLGFLSRQALLTREELRAQVMLVSAQLALLVFMPMVTAFTALHGDWSYLYLVPDKSIPSAVDLVFVIAATGSVVAGTYTAAWALRSRRENVLMIALSAPAILLLVVLAVASRRLATAATYAQYHGGYGTLPIGRSQLGRSVLASWITLSLGLTWAAYRLRLTRRSW